MKSQSYFSCNSESRLLFRNDKFITVAIFYMTFLFSENLSQANVQSQKTRHSTPTAEVGTGHSTPMVQAKKQPSTLVANVDMKQVTSVK